MKTYITLDYELFFGRHTGTAEKCMLEPTNMLCEIFDRYGAKATFFVDVGYLSRSKELCVDLQSRERVVAQLQQLKHAGHSIQLHVHPHWEDSQYVDGRWRIDATRYRLHDFPAVQRADIIGKYCALLREEIGADVFAYRAGGWCIRPFETIAESLKTNGIVLDSTLYNGGFYQSGTHSFDFRAAPRKSRWRFERDPLVESETGSFVELPIADMQVYPWFFWRMLLAKKMGGAQHKAIGDGSALPPGKLDILRMLTLPTYSVASLDGFKAGALESARRQWEKRFMRDSDFVIIGHPKSATAYSLGKLNLYFEMFASIDKHSIITRPSL